MELGQTSSDNGPASIAGENKDKVSYPSFSLRGDKMEEFLKECPDAKEVGYELTATVKLKVSGYRDDQYGKDLSLEVQSLDNNESSEGEESRETPAAETESESEQEESAEETDEEKMLGYKRPQKENKPAPGASAKDLQD